MRPTGVALGELLWRPYTDPGPFQGRCFPGQNKGGVFLS